MKQNNNKKKKTVYKTKKKNKANFLIALEKSLGVITTACKKVGITRRTYYNYIEEDEEFRIACEEIGEVALDFVESKNFENIQNNNQQAITFYLRTKGKKRGFGESIQQEIHQKIEPIVIEYDNRDNDLDELKNDLDLLGEK